MSATDNIGTSECLIGYRKMSVKSFANMVSGNEDASRFMP
jgi:hypothetical protein